MWIRKIHDEEGNDTLYAKIAPEFWPESANNYPEDYRKKVLNIIYDRLKLLSDLKTYTNYFFEEPVVDREMITKNKFLKKMSEDEIEGLLNTVSTRLSGEEDWSADNHQNVLNELLEETGKKPAELFSLIRIAVSFAPFSPALPLTLETLGKDRVLARLNML